MKFSILTASFNHADFIKETIESVLAQTYSDFEYVIYDDCSTDNSTEIIKQYAQKDSRIKFYQSEINQGLIKTYNAAIQKCSGDYIIFVESDDTITPNYIEEKIKIIDKNPNAAVIFNQINPFGDEERTNNCKKHILKTKNLIDSGSFDYYELFAVNIIPTFSCVMMKKSVLDSIPFNFKVQKCFDWYLWNYIIQKYDIVFTDKILTNFRLHNNSFSCKKTNTSVYAELLNVCEKKYKNDLMYKLFKYYKSFVQFEKLFRPICKHVDKFIYKKLYVEKQVKIIKDV